MKTIQQWLSEYGESHQNHTNKTIHWICVPSIFFSIVGLLYCIKLPLVISGVQLNVAMLVLALVTVYYITLSKTLWIGLLLFAVFCKELSGPDEDVEFVGAFVFSVGLILLSAPEFEVSDCTVGED